MIIYVNGLKANPNLKKRKSPDIIAAPGTYFTMYFIKKLNVRVNFV